MPPWGTQKSPHSTAHGGCFRLLPNNSFCVVAVLSRLPIVTYFVLGDKLAHCVKVKRKTVPSATSLSSTDKGHSTQSIAVEENDFVCLLGNIRKPLPVDFLVSVSAPEASDEAPQGPAAAL